MFFGGGCLASFIPILSDFFFEMMDGWAQNLGYAKSIGVFNKGKGKETDVSFLQAGRGAWWNN